MSSLAANDPGPLRFRDQKDYAEASRRASDKDFLVVPWEEPSVAFGGHYNIMWPKNVLLVEAERPGWRAPGRSRERRCRSRRTIRPTARSITRATPRTCSRFWMPRAATGITRTRARSPRPASRTRSGTSKYLKNDRYLGVAFKPGMGQDNSEATMCDVAVLRRRRHDEQHVRGHGHQARSTSSPTSTPTGRARKTTSTRTSRSTT